MSRPRVGWAAATVAVVALAGCGGGGSGGSGSATVLSQISFRHAYVAAESTLRSISAAVAAASSDTRAGSPGATAQSARRAALAAHAEQEASALEQLGPPPRYNTEVRDIASALNVSASDLGTMSTAVAARDARAVTGAAGSLRADAVDVRTAAARLAGSLGLAPAS